MPRPFSRRCSLVACAARLLDDQPLGTAKLFGTSQDGQTIVMEANPAECDVIATNKIPETTRASLVVSEGRVYQRTYKHLWCISAKKGTEP